MIDGKPGSAAGEIPILMYHSIDSGPAKAGFEPFVVHPGEFADQMDYLSGQGYNPVTAADVVNSWMMGRPLPSRPVVLTFDDAYADFYSFALPVLRKYDFRATLFVPTAYVGGTARWMKSLGEDGRKILSWQALQEVAGQGVEIAAHSHTHPQMDRVPGAVARDEARRSRCLLEDNLGLPVEGFAYPHSYWNNAARGALVRAGYRYGCTIAERVSASSDDRFTLPRLTVSPGVGTDGVAGLVSATVPFGGRQLDALKRFIWRNIRRTVPSLGGDPWEGRAEYGGDGVAAR